MEFGKIKNICFQKTLRTKNKPETGRKYLHVTSYKGLVFSIYYKLSKLNSKKKKTTQFLKHGRKFENTKENIQMVDKHIRRRSISLIITDAQIKTTTIHSHHFLPTRIAIIKIFKKERKSWQGCGATRTLIYYCKMVPSLWKTMIGSFLKS